ncbi:MAG: DUF4979 domain-containing protein [Prevotella sp.]|nr:DUF4979 domain-containing protein [Prevotella sp.]
MKKNILYLLALLTLFVACSDDKEFGAEMKPVTLVNELESNVGDNLTLAVGMEFQAYANIVNEGVTNPVLNWRAIDGTILSVTDDGLLRGISAGRTTVNITQSPTERVLKSFVVDVKPVATAIQLQEATLYQGTSRQLIVDVLPSGGYDLFDWESSDESLATVDENGILTASATKFGYVTITARTKDGSNLSSSAQIEVKEIVPVTDIILEGPGYDLGLGEKGVITTQLLPADATADMLEWTSSDESILTVSSTGEVTAVGYGTATITAKAESGVTETIDITVGEGTINQNFAYGIGSWTLEQSAASITQNEGYVTVNMQGGGTSKWRGDIGPSTSPGRPNVTLNVGIYRYFAVKMTRPGGFLRNNNGQGTIVLDTAKGRYQQNQGNGNNRYDILGYDETEYSSIDMDEPVVIYFDLQSQFSTGTGYHFNTSGTETVNLFKLLVADIPTTYAGTYNLYWAHTFKTMEEMEAFAAKN